MKLSFMTLGCPEWDLETVCRRGREYGFDGVDFRGLQSELDITRLPAFTSGVAATRKMLEDHGLAVAAISSSLRVCDPDNRAANLEEARRTIPVARDLGCGIVRVFGGGNLEMMTREAAAAVGRDCLGEILALDGGEAIHWVFETHDHWICSKDCALLLDCIPDPNFGALWDMGHTSRVGGETPAETVQALRGRIGYTHVKDAVHEPGHPQAMKDGWRYVPPGTGQLPLAEAIGELKKLGYDGWVNFEHEKRWHPGLPEPEDIFPAFIAWARPLIG
ncbi:MAG: sugar phosphate isomerase/epimerase [Puniceicoccaceae bacterium]|nr:MAG: sugar phosphate isomerase/epimerase [Puniceicoccaceae bacterium]